MKFKKCLKLLQEVNKFDPIYIDISDSENSLYMLLDDVKISDLKSKFSGKDYSIMVSKDDPDKIVFELREIC